MESQQQGETQETPALPEADVTGGQPPPWAPPEAGVPVEGFAAEAPPEPPVPETIAAPRRGRRGIWVCILALAFLGGAGTGAYYYLEQRAQEMARLRAEEAARLEAERLERARGSVRVVSEPAGAEVFCDGKRVGLAPTTVGDLRLGRHDFKLTLEGHEEAVASAEVRENEVTSLGVVRMTRSVGAVRISTVPEGAEFLLEPAGQSAELAQTSGIEGPGVAPHPPMAPLDLRTPVATHADGFGLQSPESAAMPMAGGLGPAAGGDGGTTAPGPASPPSDGRRTYRGTSPAQIDDVPTGRYSLKVQRGSWVLRRDVEILRNQLVSVTPEFVFGAVIVTSEPPGAWVKRDGIALGQTPLRLGEVKPGPVTFTLEMEGYQPAVVSRNVAAAEEVALAGALQAFGEVVIVTEPEGATVAVNGQPMGQSPLAIRGVAGTVQVKLALAGYFEEEMALAIQGGQRLEHRVVLQKPSGHGIGIPVPGKPGYVRSPYSPNSGLVEVRDFATGRPYARGTEIKCPFTGRVFLVP